MKSGSERAFTIDAIDERDIKQSEHAGKPRQLTILAPLILATYLLFLFGRKIIYNVKCLADFLRALAFDHIGDSLTGQIQQRLNVQVVGSENEFKKCALVDLDKLLVPLVNIVERLVPGLVIDGRRRIVAVVRTPFNNLLQNGPSDVG